MRLPLFLLLLTTFTVFAAPTVDEEAHTRIARQGLLGGLLGKLGIKGNPLQDLINKVKGNVQDLLNKDRKFSVPVLNIKDPLKDLNVPDMLKEKIAELKQKFGEISEEIRNKLKDVCKGLNCKGQTKAFLDMRKAVWENAIGAETKVRGSDASKDIAERLNGVLAVKKALIEKAGLADEVDPADDGVFQKDIILTKEQSAFLLNELDQGGTTVEIPSVPGAKAKRSSLYLEEAPTQKWDLAKPIPYTFDPSLESYDQADIRTAIQQIEAVTCVRFQYQASPSGNHVYYTKVDAPNFCGLSYIGRVDPVNVVWLSFACGNNVGVAIHETMHALGAQHEQLRYDRDTFITMQWSNVNPQQYDFFAIADPKTFTSYGVPYDYGSIMHYNQYTAAKDATKPTMVAKNDPGTNGPLMGQRNGLSAKDIELINKMYCKPACPDTNVYCGPWANLGQCATSTWMTANCKKSCNVC